MVIKEGDYFECIKDVIMEADGEIAYIKGKQYRSELDNCITIELGDIEHYWNDVDYMKNHFAKKQDSETYLYNVALPVSGSYEGEKESCGKLSYELDFEFIEGMAQRMAQNKSKYPPYNWKKPLDPESLKQALFRHVVEIMKENYQDDGRDYGHFESIALNAMMIVYQLKNNKIENN